MRLVRQRKYSLSGLNCRSRLLSFLNSLANAQYGVHVTRPDFVPAARCVLGSVGVRVHGFIL